MPRVVWSPPALADLERLHSFLNAKNPSAAVRALRVIRAGVKDLGAFPEMGRNVEGLDTEFREWPVPFGRDGYLVLYRFHWRVGERIRREAASESATNSLVMTASRHPIIREVLGKLDRWRYR